MTKLPVIEAVIFDLDGTLTVPVLDFDAIRSEIGIADRTPVLEGMNAMPPDRRARAEAILARHELKAAQTAQLNPGAADLIAFLAERAIPTALLTRNSRVSVEAFCRKFAMRFDAVHTREDGPTKPSPEPVLHLCRQMAVRPESTLMVGDYLFDILAGLAAGSWTCLLFHKQRPAFADKAHLAVESLAEIAERVEFASLASGDRTCS